VKTTCIIFLFILNIPLCKGQNYDDKQIITMLNQYYKQFSTSKLLGNHIFTINGNTVFQIEVLTNIEDFNMSMLDAFAVINKLSVLAKTNFVQAIVILHFKENQLPIVTKAKLDCSEKFFIKKTQNETHWRKNCLSIQIQ
tara:strand:- start:204 stop:623 length:420 start_codon:yes stop_codon:yes gene_type:complete